MTKYIDNINCALHLCDTENEEWNVQIANYGLSPLVVINEILATRNKEVTTQKLLILLFIHNMLVLINKISSVMACSNIINIMHIFPYPV